MDDRDFEIELRGYNKEEVNLYINELESEYKQKLTRMEAKTREAEKQIDELSRRIEKKERQKEELEREIETKYKTYIENYDKIAGLVYESQLKADRIVADAEQRAQEILDAARRQETRILADAQKVMDDAKAQERLMLDDAEVEARRRVNAVQGTVEAGLADGRTRFADIRVQIKGMIDLLEEAKARFEQGCGEANAVFASMPEDISKYATEDADFDEDEPDDTDFEALDPEDL